MTTVTEMINTTATVAIARATTATLYFNTWTSVLPLKHIISNNIIGYVYNY